MIFRILQTLRRWIFGGIICPCCSGRGVVNNPFPSKGERCPLCSGWQEVPHGLAYKWEHRNDA